MSVSSLGFASYLAGSSTSPVVCRIDALGQVTAFRAAVIQQVFSGAGLPSALADTTTTGVTSPITTQGQTGPTNLLSVDHYTFDAHDNNGTLVGTTSNWWCYRPTAITKNNKLVIMSFGHCDTGSEWTFGQQALLASTLVQAGYTVCAGEMSPFQGTGGQMLTYHTALPDPTSSYDPTRVFVQGPIRAANKLLPEGFTKLFAVGYSGGGWLMAILGAVDTRFTAIAAHAGFFPLYMTNTTGGSGGANNRLSDKEERILGLASLTGTGVSISGCDYTDLVALACLPGRSMIQSFDDTDPTCFDLTTYNAYHPYIPELANRIHHMGGEYTGTFDVNSLHGYSSARITAILNFFNAH